MKRKLYHLILVLCTGVFLISVWHISRDGFVYRQAETEYARIRKQTETEGERQRKIDFSKLRKMNPDVIGWIYAEGTGIDYPVVKGKNNGEYLTRTFTGKHNKSGCIFMDCEGKRDFSGDNNILYGHHMRNGSMFADLLKFRDPDFLKQSKGMILYMPHKTMHLTVISAYAAKADCTVPLSFGTMEETRRYFKMIERNSEVPGGYSFENRKKLPGLYTFITCSYEQKDNRTFVHAVESDVVDEINKTK